MKQTNETPTGGIFYCRDSAKMKGCGSLQTSSPFDSDVLRNRQQKHTANPLATSRESRAAKLKESFEKKG
jgi:hypothetical protein